ncbi:UDP-N-acetylmuramoyl-L-alanyl-D-glutamate--2,6-diaminopimelate ligase [Thermodesulfobacteriota bacterium]
MKLSTLLKTVAPLGVSGINRAEAEHILGPESVGAFGPDISSIHYRSQDVKPGGLFVAIPGHTVDGHEYIDEVLQRGAVAIVTQKPAQKESIIIEVENSRRALAEISCQFYDNPSEKLFVIGITGTNGKTTTAFLIESILAAAGYQVGVIGTINYRYMGIAFENTVTTPESLDLQRILSEMLNNGVSHVVLEVSSHAVDLDRIDGCRFDIGVFTNLTQDHLDYHGNMHNYWTCKKKFFTGNLSQGPKDQKAAAVVCCNNSKGKELLKTLAIQTLSVGYSKNHMVRSHNIKAALSGISGEISTPAGDFKFNSSLVGTHNLENILCAAGVGIVLNLSLDIIQAGIENLTGVPGRLESIANDLDRFVCVDYAHTPDALKNVLSSLRLISDRRIICVFGCGGDRDKDKRPQMGEIAGRICDLAIITSDNPRTEDPLKIISQILEGLKLTSSSEFTAADLITGFTKKGHVVEPNRRQAIQLGITVSRTGDIVLIAGKGHETYQIIGKQTVPFDDRLEAQKALAAQTFKNRQTADSHQC